MASCGVHSDHPRYFGLFNPPALPEAILGDLLAAAVNPQLAVIEHAPVAALIEKRLIAEFGARIGWVDTVGHFTSGGSEANQTAVLAALARFYPDWGKAGVPNFGKRPTIYASELAHLAWLKLARMTGLGADAVRLVPARDDLRLHGEDLRIAITRDTERAAVLIVGTAGTTAHGAIDDLEGLAAVARDAGAHVHVDAAWAGAALLAPEFAPMFAGVERADSVTIDAHKWMAVPMGAGMYLARESKPLTKAFAVTTDYMPSGAALQPYLSSIQWSRRFIGLKVFLAFGSLGMRGYAEAIRRQVALGGLLRRALVDDGWRICNETAMPVVCFCSDRVGADHTAIAASVEASGEAWISTVKVNGLLALRACITSPETDESDVQRLVAALNEARGASQAKVN